VPEDSTGVWAVVAAAGRGERLAGGRPKAFAKLAGRPLLAESLERLEGSEWVEAIVVVAPPDWEEPSILLAEELGAGKVTACVTGGATRAESVRVGVREVPADAAVILVHDAARPLLPPEVIDRVVAALGEGWDGAVPAVAVTDTLKRAVDGQVVETLDRSDVYAAQTPQAFVAAALRRALEDGAAETDCAALVESTGGRVALVEGDARLLKVTTVGDLVLVQSLMGQSLDP
jgi:2-C-methyl-D-erythritol 4-phosphate cytidylyltransferase